MLWRQSQDYEMAVEWYTRAAEQGESYAQCRLGDFYLEGKGVPRCDEEAAKWYCKAMEQDDDEGLLLGLGSEAACLDD